MRFARLALRFVTVLVALATAACAPDVLRRPTQLTPVSDQPAVIIEVMDTAIVSLERGFRRRIPRGSTWKLIGRSPEGEVFRPVDQVFTVEGEHVHEAFLILDGDRVVGFYLPVERAFAPARGGTDTRLSIRRRER
jgi:hypothetical protein